MSRLSFERIGDGAVISAGTDPEIGSNVNGPSLMRVPSWASSPGGARYWMYFAHHEGKSIRLAVAQQMEGPWEVVSGGVLALADTGFPHHIASPDVHQVPEQDELRMYFHGGSSPAAEDQCEAIAVSSDGINFRETDTEIGPFYWRVFLWDGWWYALVMPGKFYRSRDGLTQWEEGPTCFQDSMRHSAVLVDRGVLYVFYSRIGDEPEQIVMSTVRLTHDWAFWTATSSIPVLSPEHDYEGALLPPRASSSGMAVTAVNELRDPAVMQDEGWVYLAYSVAGEQGIALARTSLRQLREVDGEADPCSADN